MWGTRSFEDSFNGHQHLSLDYATSKTLEKRWTEVPMCRKSQTGVKSGTVLQLISSSTNKVFWGQFQWASKPFANNATSETLERRWTEVPIVLQKSAVQQTRSLEDRIYGHRNHSLDAASSKTLERRWTEVPMRRKSQTGVKSGTVLQQTSSSTNKVFWGQFQWASKPFARYCYQ